MAERTSPGLCLSVIIPVFNERDTILELIRRVQAVPIDKEIVVVDDGSTDGTRELLDRWVADDDPRRQPASSAAPQAPTRNELRVILEPRNRGKGAAVRRGLKAATGNVLLVQDADLEYDPRDYFALLAPIERGVADAVYGSRFLGGPHRVLFFWHRVGNYWLTLLSDMFSNLNLTDVWSCYKAFRREALEGIELREDRFGFEQEITAKIAKRGARVFEVPISYYGRTYAEGKKITWRDGIRAIYCILRYSWFD